MVIDGQTYIKNKVAYYKKYVIIIIMSAVPIVSIPPVKKWINNNTNVVNNLNKIAISSYLLVKGSLVYNISIGNQSLNNINLNYVIASLIYNICSLPYILKSKNLWSYATLIISGWFDILLLLFIYNYIIPSKLRGKEDTCICQGTLPELPPLNTTTMLLAGGSAFIIYLIHLLQKKYL
jgi:hypothetical protein